MKIIYPHGEATKEEMAEMLEFAMEGRRRVKEQLKKMGSFEYYQTSFSYSDIETGEERFVGVPEQGGRNLISSDPLPPGTVYTATVAADGTVGMYRVEVSVSAGDRQAADGRRRVRRDEGVDQSRVQLHAGQEERAGDRPGDRRVAISTSRSSTCSTTESRARSDWGSSSRRFSALKKAPPMAGTSDHG